MSVQINKHAIFNNTHFNALRPMDRDLLFRNAVLYHFETHNNQVVLDGLGCFSGFDKKNVSFKDYAYRVRIIVQPVATVLGGVGELKSQNQMIHLSVPAKNARKHVCRDLQDFCEKYFTASFDDIVRETKQKYQDAKDVAEAQALAHAAAKREHDANVAAEKAVIDAAKMAEQQKIANLHAALQEASEFDWE